MLTILLENQRLCVTNVVTARTSKPNRNILLYYSVVVTMAIEFLMIYLDHFELDHAVVSDLFRDKVQLTDKH